MRNPRVFFAVLGFLVAAAAWMMLPFVTPVLVAAVMGYVLLPFYDRMGKRIRSDTLRATVLLLVVLFVVALPVLVALLELSRQAPNALRNINVVDLNAKLDRAVGRHIPLAENLGEYIDRVKEAAVQAAPAVIGRIGATALSLMLFLYTFFYVLTDGRQFWKDFVSLIPLDLEMKQHLVGNIQATMTGVLYGQVVTAAVQAGLAGLGYLLFGVPHVLLWTFLTLVASMLPVVGAALIWLPLALSRLLADDRVAGWGLLLYMGLLVSSVDNVIKPRLISGRAPLHPLAALFGVIGGLHLFGMVGILLGPVLLGLITAMLRFYRQMPHYKETAALTLLAVLLIAQPAAAHDLWLVPQRDANGWVIRAQTGEHFPKSEVALTAERVASFSVHGTGQGPVPLDGRVEGTSWLARTNADQGTAEIVVRPKILTLEIKQFEEYLRAEGLEKILVRRKARRLDKRPNPERYAKYAKALLGSAADQPLGHELEIVALNRPRAGEDAKVLLLYKGRPLSGHRIAAGTEGTVGHHYPVTATTGLDGTARLRLNRPGLWFVRSLHMIPVANDVQAVWETYFVTLTLEVLAEN